VPESKLRSADLIGRPVSDREGRPLGRVADVIIDGPRVVAVMVTRGPWGRLFGYERPEAEVSGLMAKVARMVQRDRIRELPWNEVRVDRTAAG
jgi:sporulation protein YlmC with PRC-barrel domain